MLYTLRTITLLRCIYKMTKERNNCPVPKGVLLIIGGHENKNGKADNKMQEGNDDPQEILETFLKLTGKKAPCIEVITTASSEGPESFQDYKRAFLKLGINDPGHIHHEKRHEVLNDNSTERIKAADGIFFTGGDQLKLTSIYGGSSLLEELKNRYIYNKIVVGGTSAGAMALSTPMIFAGGKDVQQMTGEVRMATGLEFLKDVCIDTHFVDRSRFVRISQVIAMNPTCIGIGIEEDTALLVQNGIEAEVIGSGVVQVIEGFDILDSNILEFSDQQPIHVDNLTVKLLSRGNKYIIPQKNPRHI